MSSKNLKIKETFLNSVHFLPNGTQWTGDVHYYSETHPSPEGFIGFMTGGSFNINAVELVTFPTGLDYPSDYDPGSNAILNTVFTDVQTSGLIGEIEIGKIVSSINVLKNTIKLNKQSINSAVNQIIGAVDANVNQLEENGVGILEDSLSDEVVSLEAEGIVNFNSNVSAITYENNTGSEALYLFHGNAETDQEQENGWNALLTNTIGVDIISRIDTLYFSDIVDNILTNFNSELEINDFRYIPSSVDTGFHGCLVISLDTPSKITHLKLLFGTLIDITAVYANDDTLQLGKLSWNLYNTSGIVPLYNIKIYFQCITTEPFKSKININADGEITDMITYLWEDVMVEEEDGSEDTIENDGSTEEGGGY